MVSPEHLLSVRIRCRCGGELPGCVRVERQVPPKLRCPPSGGRRASDPRIRCPKCGHVCFADYEHLERATNDLVRSPAWGHYMNDGYVPIPCAG